MSEATPQVDNNATQGVTAEKTFTQAEMDAIIGERLSRERAKYADYDEAKAALDELTQLKEANKSELEKAVEERDKYKAEIEAMKAEKERADLVAKVAAENGVDASLLARMSGDVEENAAYLKQTMANAPKFGQVPDGGEVTPPASKETNAQKFGKAFDQMLGA